MRLRLTTAALLLVVAGVHFQQYVDFMSHVPTVGVLFLLNAAGGVALALTLLGPDRELRGLSALGGIGLVAGGLVCVVIALASSFAGFHEPSLRLPIVIAIVAEVLALPACAAVAVSERRRPRTTAPRRPSAQPS
jgi:hypothetical protein